MFQSIIPKSLDKRIWVLFTGNIVNMFGMSMVWLFITVYLNVELGISMTFIGTMFMIGTWLAVITQIIGGSLTDLIGRRTIMVSGLLLQGLSLYALGFSTDKTSFFILFIFEGMVGSLYRPAAQAMVADLVNEEQRLEAYGILRVGANAGYGIGAMMGGILAASSYKMLFFIAGTTTLIYLVLSLYFLKETLPITKSDVSLLRGVKEYFSGYSIATRDKILLIYAIACAMDVFAYSQAGTTLSVYAMKVIGIETRHIGTVWALNAWMVVILQLPISQFLKRIKITYALAMGAFLYGCAYMIIPFATTFSHVVIFMLVFTTGELVISPVIMTFVANISPVDMRGRYMAFSNMTQTMGQSLGPFVGGKVMDTMDTRYLWYLTSSVTMLGAILFLRLESYIRKDSNRCHMLKTK